VPDRSLPDVPNLEQYRKQAKELLRDARAGEPAAQDRVRKHSPRLRNYVAEQSHLLTLADAQWVLAREHGYPSWAAFAQHIETLRILRSVEELDDPHGTFLEVACVDRHGWHASGSLEHAEMLLSRYPAVATESLYSSAVIADEAAVRAWLGRDASLATAKGGPHGWDALTYLCFSRYLRIDKDRSASFVSCARALLEAGASANTGWTETIDDPPRPVPETAIYGAAGIAQNVALTQLLLDYGADPNDEETPYHVPETYDNSVLKIVLASGRLHERSLATVAVRKCDWHDEAGLQLALEHGANPNFISAWKHSPFHHSIRRDNGLVMIELFLDHGADPRIANGSDGRNAFEMAAYHGRGDVLDALERRGFKADLSGLDALVALCARAQTDAARSMVSGAPDLLAQLHAMGGSLLARFAGADHDGGVCTLLALGVSAHALWMEGDGYWEITAGSTALHVAAWRAHHSVVGTLLAAGTAVDARDAKGRTALQLAVKACTDSYWKYRRKADSVAALLAAGASRDGIDWPTGYDAIDALLDPDRPCPRENGVGGSTG
jgi:ankyrin repeat protein